VVFDSVRKGFGGRLRFVVSGGAPLAGRVQEYLQIALCCPVLQGYGLTETCVRVAAVFAIWFNRQPSGERCSLRHDSHLHLTGAQLLHPRQSCSLHRTTEGM
jgi:acyl-CoA synthetase (AMP-forming)/AMP-acid ligase II